MGSRGFSVCWEPWGPRELGVAPVGERWEVGRPREAGVRGDRERRKGTEWGANPPPREGQQRSEEEGSVGWRP